MQEGLKLANQNNCAFVETSAKNDINVGSSPEHISGVVVSSGFLTTRFLIAKVFELCLQEIEKRTAPNQGDQAPAKGCQLM